MLVDTLWDSAVVDVLNVPEDIIFVKKGEKWGGIRIKEGVALPVNWELQPSEDVKLRFNNWKYNYHWDFYRHQILDGKTEIMLSTKIFFNEYFSDKSMELRLLPNFTMGETLDWSSLSDFIIANTSSDEWADGYMTEEEFDKYVKKFFGNINYSPVPNAGLTFQDGKYIASGGLNTHGGYLYELTALEKGKTKDGKDKWKAHIKGYFFNDMDGNTEDDNGQSKNDQVIRDEMNKEENKGLSFQRVLAKLGYNDPWSKLDLSCEWIIEFTVNEPLGDIYFTYLSCESF